MGDLRPYSVDGPPEAEPLLAGQIQSLAKCVEEQALQNRVVLPIQSVVHRMLDREIPFVVFEIRKSRKEEAPSVSRDGIDVFMPYEQKLYVCDASPEHVCLLNKYPQLPGSLVVPTKALVPQESNMTQTDLSALWTVVQGVRGFGFFNCGRNAGYSQEHKHFQVVPMPQAVVGERLPIETALDRAAARAQAMGRRVFMLDEYDFAHAVTMLPADMLRRDSESGAACVFQAYVRLMHAVRIPYPQQPIDRFVSYNFICTPRWCMLVPRSAGSWNKFFHNSFVFCGLVLCPIRENVATLQTSGVLHTMASVGFPRAELAEAPASDTAVAATAAAPAAVVTLPGDRAVAIAHDPLLKLRADVPAQPLTAGAESVHRARETPTDAAATVAVVREPDELTVVPLPPSRQRTA